MRLGNIDLFNSFRIWYYTMRFKRTWSWSYRYWNICHTMSFQNIDNKTKFQTIDHNNIDRNHRFK